MLFTALLTLATANGPPSLSPSHRQDIINALKDKLLDGDSAKWRWPQQSPNRTAPYCGWYNAKNSYGAYVGWRPYYVIGVVNKSNKYVVITSSLDQSSVVDITEEYCVRYGYDMRGPPPEQ